MTRRIYMDHHATTPCDPRVVEAMLPWFTERPGNPSSPHLFGWEAEEAVERAKSQIAELVGADPKEVLFTSGATESNNLALFGAMERYRRRGRHLVTSNLEHPAVLEASEWLEGRGAECSVVECDERGLLSAEGVGAALRDDTVICSIMGANNEIGTVQPVREIAALCRERGVLFHVDGAQSVGRIPTDVNADGIDLLSIAGHKLYGPKGIGALVVSRRNPRVRLQPQQIGGGQQGGVRPGTLPVPLIVGLGEACALAGAELESESRRLRALRDRLLAHFAEGDESFLINGDLEERLPGNLSVSFPGVEASAVLLELPGIGLSSGSACSADHHEPSHVLKAIGRRTEDAHATLRFGLGRGNTEAEVDEVARAVLEVVRRLRADSPVHAAVRGPGRPNDPDAPLHRGEETAR